MSETPDRTYRIDWHESFSFIRLFESLPVSLSWAAMSMAFVGVALTIVVGYSLDGLWLNSASPVAYGAHNELTWYLSSSGDAVTATREWAKLAPEGAARVGVFELLLQHGRQTLNAVSDAVLSVSPRGLYESMRFGLRGLVWLLSMHLGFAIAFGLLALLIWAICGGAISRAAVMRFARDETIHRLEAFAFALRRAASLFGAPLIPIFFILAMALLLYLGGWIGAIPWIGEILVGLFFVLLIFLGAIIALALVSLIVGYPIFAPAVVSDDRDAWDAVQSVVSYAWARPWKLIFYYLVALAYGGLCLQVAKWLVMLSLWATGTFLGASMNHGDAFGIREDGTKTRVEHKLDAMWIAPRLSAEDPFYGTRTEEPLRHASWFGRGVITLWIFILWAVVAAFAGSFLFTSASMIFLLLRREVDFTDLSEVYLDLPEKGAETASASGALPQNQAAGI